MCWQLPSAEPVSAKSGHHPDVKLVSPQQVGGQLKVGAPLPFGVRDAEGNLPLAKGQRLPNEQMHEAMLACGVFVDLGMS